MNCLRRRTRRLAYLFLLGMFLLNCAVAWNARALVRQGHPDFTTFYSAGKLVREGLGPRLYDSGVQYRSQQEFATGVETGGGPLPYIHPPFEALIFVPFTLFPYVTAFLLWDAVCILILIGVQCLLTKSIPALNEIGTPFWILSWLAFFPVFVSLLQGQDIIVLLGLLTLFFVFLRDGHDMKAGLWLGLGTFRFHALVPLLFVLIFRRKWKLLLGFGLTAATAVLISFLVAGWHGMLEYPHFIWQVETYAESHRTAAFLAMPNLRGLFDDLPFANHTLTNIVTIVCSFLLLVVTALKWKDSDLGFALCLIAMVLTGYHTLPYDLSVLVLAIVLVLTHMKVSLNLSCRGSFFLLAPIVILFFSPLQWFLVYRSASWAAFAWVLLIWFLAIAFHISAAARAETPPQASHS